jgi:hypothetical protein
LVVQLLRKRYVGAGLQADDDELLLLIRTRTAVLSVLSDWIRVGGGAQDILDDDELYEKIQTFLDSHLDQQLPLQSRKEASIRRAYGTLTETRRLFRDTLVSQTRRPTTRRNAVHPSLTDDFGKNPPDVDALAAEELVAQLDAMGAAVSSALVDEVSLICSLLEGLT